MPSLSSDNLREDARLKLCLKSLVKQHKSKVNQHVLMLVRLKHVQKCTVKAKVDSSPCRAAWAGTFICLILVFTLSLRALDVTLPRQPEGQIDVP